MGRSWRCFLLRTRGRLHAHAGTASKKQHDWVTKLGADQVVDYHDADWFDQIVNEPKNKGLSHTFECILASLPQCYDTMARCGATDPQLVTIDPRSMMPEEVQGKSERGLTYVWTPTAYHDDQQPALVETIRILAQMLADGTLVPNRVNVLGGLEEAAKGLQMLADKKVSGEKLIVHPNK